MKRIFFIFLVFCFFSGGAFSAQTRPKKKKPVQTSDAKIVYEPDAEMLRDLRAKVRVAESKRDWTKLNRQAATFNPSKTRSAYAAELKMESDAQTPVETIVAYDSQTNKFYEIRGIEDFPGRPFSDLRWISNDVLQFEQWVNPNSGGRYRVNLKTGKIVAAGYVRSL